MKRAVTVAEPEEAGRCLKRANSSGFSIATLAEDDHHGPSSSAVDISAILGGEKSPGLLLVDNDDESAGDSVSGSSYEEMKASALVTFDCSDDDDDNEAADGASTSCSSSELDDEQDDNIHEGVGKSKQDASAREDDIASWSFQGEVPVNTMAKSNDHRTGLVFESGTKHFDRHNRFHKERPLRITSVHDYLAKNAKPSDGEERTIFERCKLLESRGGEVCVDVNSKRSPEELWLDDHDYLRVHLPGYLQRLDKISKCNCHNRLDIEADQYKSIYFTSDSVREAKAAASSLCNLVSRVASGSLDNGFAVIRPPGHHAEPGLAGGYCVMNNVAVAAAYAREKLGMKKVLIVDWDVHHGNGTQRCFINNPNILYFSVHRYHSGNFFPFLQGGGPAAVGGGQGEGFNINVGWNETRMGDDEYLALWEKLLMPVAAEFDPALVLVSAGFDAARGDVGECDVTPECFARLTRRLKTLADGRVVCALEGGYVRSVLCRCVESVLSALLDAASREKCEEELRNFYKNVGDNEMLDCINPSAAKSIKDTMKAHSRYWDCLKARSGD